MDLAISFCNVSTIAVCLIFKIPQILKIIQSKSTVGISLASVLAELLTYTITLTYNVSQVYPLGTYFEYYFCVVQDIVLVFILFHYKGSLDFLKFGAMGLFVSTFYGLSIGIPNPNIILVLIKTAGLIGASSKLIQLKEILTTKESDNISVLSWSISAYTCTTRICTTLLLTGDVSLLTNFTIALVLNLSIISSALYYQKPKTKSQQN